MLTQWRSLVRRIPSAHVWTVASRWVCTCSRGLGSCACINWRLCSFRFAEGHIRCSDMDSSTQSTERHLQQSHQWLQGGFYFMRWLFGSTIYMYIHTQMCAHAHLFVRAALKEATMQFFTLHLPLPSLLQLNCTNIKCGQLSFLKMLSSTATQVIQLHHHGASLNIIFKFANGDKVPASAITMINKVRWSAHL